MARSPGPSRVLAVAYGFFVVAAGARSAVQISTAFGVAPLAYLLSAGAAVVYTGGLAAFVLVERRPDRRRWAIALCAGELCGVAAVGLASELVPSAFPDATVWSGFGAGYGYVPVALPVLGLATCLLSGRARPTRARREPAASRHRTGTSPPGQPGSA